MRQIVVSWWFSVFRLSKIIADSVFRRPAGLKCVTPQAFPKIYFTLRRWFNNKGTGRPVAPFHRQFPCGTCDVEVRPRVIFGEVRQEGGGGNRAAPGSTDVRNVGKVGFELVFVGIKSGAMLCRPRCGEAASRLSTKSWLLPITPLTS